MITTDLVNIIFDKYNSLPSGADIVADRNMHELMEFAIDNPYVDFDGDRLIFAKGQGPLKSIEIERICGAHDFGSHMAIVTPNSMYMINKADGQMNVILPD